MYLKKHKPCRTSCDTVPSKSLCKCDAYSVDHWNYYSHSYYYYIVSCLAPELSCCLNFDWNLSFSNQIQNCSRPCRARVWTLLNGSLWALLMFHRYCCHCSNQTPCFFLSVFFCFFFIITEDSRELLSVRKWFLEFIPIFNFKFIW